MDRQPESFTGLSECLLHWIGAAYDHIVADWVEETTYAINNATLEARLYDDFNSMGGSAGFRSIFPGCGEENHQELISIAQKYDHHGVFQTLMPGGFQVF
ncbi:FAD-binding domain-containing protein [Penicillium maclennaniae]|uniref:FAD-binding domain-containing protein n=1 Tax=Penicillium maclennaniae TaxID=1343394 RepID=UPI002542043D|nr:FAD-binding domain-containing protein [Penicillium maclennaniae]KAJ5670523.1 FAD-binding domain-containing protein [Penicillium maclennaniae]